MAHLQWMAAVSLAQSKSLRSGAPPRRWVALAVLVPILATVLLTLVTGDG